MTTWIFREPGCIPGIPGQFAGVSVTTNADGTLDIQPLVQPPHDAPIETEEQSEPELQAEAE